MVLPETDHAGEHVGSPQERAVARMRSADHDVVAATGADGATVDQELLSGQARQPRFLVDGQSVLAQLVPGMRRVDIDLDHARVRGDLDQVEPAVARRRITFDAQRRPDFGGHVLGGGDQVEEVLGGFDRRHEQIDPAVTRLHRQGGADVAALVVRAPRLGLRLAPLLGETLFAARIGLTAGLQKRLARRIAVRQRRHLPRRVGDDRERIFRRRQPRQGVQRHAQADRRVAGNQQQIAVAEIPALADPGAARQRLPALHRQHVAARRVEPAFEHAGQARAFFGVAELVLDRIDVVRQ